MCLSSYSVHQQNSIMSIIHTTHPDLPIFLKMISKWKLVLCTTQHYKICNGTSQHAFVTIKLKSSFHSSTNSFCDASTRVSSNCLQPTTKYAKGLQAIFSPFLQCLIYIFGVRQPIAIIWEMLIAIITEVMYPVVWQHRCKKLLLCLKNIAWYLCCQKLNWIRIWSLYLTQHEDESQHHVPL